MGAAYAAITETMRFFLGEDKPLSFQVKDENEVPVNIAGWTFTWQLRADPNDDDPAVLTKTTPSFRDDAQGIVEFIIPRADTQNLRPGRYHHALARTNSGSFWHVSEGPAVLLPAVAR